MCSPGHYDNAVKSGTCYSKQELEILIELYNKQHPSNAVLRPSKPQLLLRREGPSRAAGIPFFVFFLFPLLSYVISSELFSMYGRRKFLHFPSKRPLSLKIL